MHPLAYLPYTILGIISFALIIFIILQVLLHFKLVNPHQPLIVRTWDVLDKLFTPALNKIRKYLPPVQGFDLSPIVIFVVIEFLRYTLRYYFS